jgi:uncharacterized membrane protein YgcG
MISKSLSILSKVALTAALVIGCAPEKHKHHKKTVSVHSYQTHSSSSDGGNELLYWYIIYSSMNGNSGVCPCYSYSSPSPVTNFNSVDFAKTETVPSALSSGTGAVEEPVQEVTPEELPDQMETDINENFDTNDSQESGAAEEGFDESNDNSGDNSGDNASDGGSDAGSDGGSSDGGGSDGGGGDGGGGGGD